ncbi:MAG: sulfurtransferase complex subunit TusB [Burkholderiales bacterium]
MLHIVNKSPFENNTLNNCLRLVKPGAAILLIEDAVYAATKGAVAERVLKDAMGMGTVKIYALWPDLEARGVQDRVIDGIKLVDYGGFVDLAAEHSTTQSWL